jgi:peptidoglycan/xylan/chitin deacetylase (PgdA/CDA1 family)
MMFPIATPILVYHHITPATPPKKFGNFAMSVNQFERQMRYLHEHQYVCLPLADLLQHSDKGSSLPKRTFALTFDDGYEDFFAIADPILRAFSFTATVFVVTDNINGQSDSKRVKYKQYLTWEQIEKLQQTGIIFGSHTCTHPMLPSLSREEIHRELAASKECLETRLGQEINWLAYPHGVSTSEIQKMAEVAGYKAAFGVSRGMSGRFNIWRRLCLRGDTLVTFSLRLNHWYHYPGHIREDTEVGRFLRKVKYRIGL